MKLKVFYYREQEVKGMLRTKKISTDAFINENAILYIDISNTYRIHFEEQVVCIEDKDSREELKKQLNNYIQINTENETYFINKNNYSYMEKTCETQMIVYFRNGISISINNIIKGE